MYILSEIDAYVYVRMIIASDSNC